MATLQELQASLLQLREQIASSKTQLTTFTASALGDAITQYGEVRQQIMDKHLETAKSLDNKSLLTQLEEGPTFAGTKAAVLDDWLPKSFGRFGSKPSNPKDMKV